MAENYEGEVSGYPDEIILDTAQDRTPNYVVSVNGQQGAVIVSGGGGGGALTPVEVEGRTGGSNTLEEQSLAGFQEGDLVPVIFLEGSEGLRWFQIAVGDAATPYDVQPNVLNPHGWYWKAIS